MTIWAMITNIDAGYNTLEVEEKKLRGTAYQDQYSKVKKMCASRFVQNIYTREQDFENQ